MRSSPRRGRGPGTDWGPRRGAPRERARSREAEPRAPAACRFRARNRPWRDRKARGSHRTPRRPLPRVSLSVSSCFPPPRSATRPQPAPGPREEASGSRSTKPRPSCGRGPAGQELVGREQIWFGAAGGGDGCGNPALIKTSQCEPVALSLGPAPPGEPRSFHVLATGLREAR